MGSFSSSSSPSSFSFCMPGASPSVKLICFTILLVFVAAFFSILGPKAPVFGLTDYYPRSSSSSPPPPSNSISSSSSSSPNSSSSSVHDGSSSKVTTRNEEVTKEAEKSEDSVVTPPQRPQPQLVAAEIAPGPSPTDGVGRQGLLMMENDNISSMEDDSGSELNMNHAPPMTPTMPPPPPIELEKVSTDLDKLEAGLQQARAAIIKEAKHGFDQPHDPDFVPLGPMYWNANAFHRSYLEMEKRFKVYVYEEREAPLFHNGPCKSIYSSEGNFIHLMEVSPFRTRDPNKAHVFFLPFSVVMLVRFVYVRDSHDLSPIRQTVQDYINLLSTNYPYWNRSLAADHFMLSCHDWGPETSKSNPYLYNNSIRVLCNANTSEGFNPEKDVSFPEINLQSGTIRGFVGGPSPSRRSILAFFAGGLHGPIRPILLQHWENKQDGDIKVFQYLPKGMEYYDMLRSSKFCLCPSGWEVASPRIVEAIYTGCVPVLLNDNYVPPFSDVLNWKSFSVEVKVEDIPNLKTILEGISTRQYLKMHRRVLKVRRHFEVHFPPKRFDFFHMVLHSVWVRRLNIRIRRSCSSDCRGKAKGCVN